MIVGTAGHIDHGKTSLVRALTGIDTDRLPEEKARGITLDLGFAYQPLEGGGVLGFVDVPGHERLVHTMIAGASSIDMGLLVVAADDGVMPQTREHLQVLSLLGITRGIVVVTKADLADVARVDEVFAETRALLRDTSLATAKIVAVSTVTGAGIADLKACLLAQAGQVSAGKDAGERTFRLSVDRSFSLAGAGTIVTGSIVAGTVRRNDPVLVQPSGLEGRVRAVHVANRPVDQAFAGDRCAINLIGPGIAKDAISRGNWIEGAARQISTLRCDASLHLLAGEAAAMRQGTPVLLHHGAAQVVARVAPLDAPSLSPGATGLVHLILDRPLPLRHADRLVLRDISATRTIAGGRVLDPRPPGRHRRQPARLAALRQLSAADPREAIQGVFAAPPHLVRRQTLQEDWGLTPSGLRELLPDARTYGAFITSSSVAALLEQDLIAALSHHHERHPDIPGVRAEILRAEVTTRLPRDAFGALLAGMVDSGKVIADGPLLRMPQHRGGMADHEECIWNALLPLLQAEPYKPPSVREAATRIGIGDAALRRACKTFARLGLVIELAPDRFFQRPAAIKMAEIAHILSAETGAAGFSAAQFRDQLGNGRQLAIQILESFDRRGITIRRGDLRVAGKEAKAAFGGGPGEP